MVSAPRKDIFKIATFVKSIEIGVRNAVAFDPVVCEDSHVSITHQLLTQQIRAVVYRSSEQTTLLDESRRKIAYRGAGAG